MSDLAEIKAAARKAAFARRKAAHAAAGPDTAALLSQVLAGHRGVPLAGYMPIRTEIDPRPAMEEAALHGPVGVPVIEAAGAPLRFSRWTPGCALKEGPFGAMIPQVDAFFEPEILIVPLVAFDDRGYRLGYGGGFYDRSLELLRAKRRVVRDPGWWHHRPVSGRLRREYFGNDEGTGMSIFIVPQILRG